jgi:hypothetical protein
MLASKLKMTTAIHPVRQRSRAMQLRQVNVLRHVERHSSALEERIAWHCEMAIATSQQDICHSIPEGRAT